MTTIIIIVIIINNIIIIVLYTWRDGDNDNVNNNSSDAVCTRVSLIRRHDVYNARTPDNVRMNVDKQHGTNSRGRIVFPLKFCLSRFTYRRPRRGRNPVFGATRVIIDVSAAAHR